MFVCWLTVLLTFSGDEVLEWNGTPLRGKYKEQVASIIALSKNEQQVKLLISRPYG